MTRILEILAAQRRATGSDDLAEKRFETLVALERDFATDRRYIGEMLRVQAARAIDHGELATSRTLLARSLRLHPLNLLAWRTVAYYIRRRTDA
ncbi:hypothetical protein [Sphingomonas sp. HDW15A]|uniref:hypothetical protein n=1 Tax=Sphingomonas sp. HDW15A TaxID=2714942 RepID=UPI001F0CE292|nr:hypothetical protein [Sphingomonas sp. HDW15A]